MKRLLFTPLLLMASTALAQPTYPPGLIPPCPTTPFTLSPGLSCYDGPGNDVKVGTGTTTFKLREAPASAITLQGAKDLGRLITNAIAEGQSVEFGEPNNRTKVWCTATGCNMLLPGSVTNQMSVGEEELWTDSQGQAIQVLAETDRSVTYPGQTASKCARFDANKKLVSASGDCSAGDTGAADTYVSVFRYNCQDGGAQPEYGRGSDATAGSACQNSDTLADNTRRLTVFAGTAKNLYCVLSAVPHAGSTWTYTVRKNGSDTAVTCAINDASTTCNDTANTVAVAAGDTLSLKHSDSAATDGTQVIHCAFAVVSP